MRSRSMRALPVKKSIWCPACSASASRGCCDGDVLDDAGRRPPVALHQVRDRREVPALLRRRGQGAGGGQRLARHRHAGGLGAEQVQPGAQRVAHHEARAVLERPVHRRHRVAGVDLEFPRACP